MGGAQFWSPELEPFEIQAERKDGSIATIEANLRPIYMDERCTGVQAIAHDISERKEMEFQYFSKNSLHHLKHSTYVLA
ncbi:MAG: PAS domain S-box protein, partial [Bacteroidales bacterium]|nr:PAS domain S-box protein [Bacteroidales bacterium]